MPIMYDKEAETCVLGSIIIDPLAMSIVVKLIGEQTTKFFFAQHQIIYEVMLGMWKKSMPIDLVTITSSLKSSGSLERVGGLQSLYRIQESVPSALNVEYYAGFVLSCFERREIAKLGEKLSGLANNEWMGVEEVKNLAQSMVFSMSTGAKSGGFVTPENLLEGTMAHLQYVYENRDKILGISTGIPELDQMLSGMNVGDLIVLAARPSMGKSALAHNIIQHVSLNMEKPTALFSLEMSNSSVMSRLISACGSVDMQKMRTGKLNHDDWIRLTEAASRLESIPMFMCESSSVTIAEILSETRRLKLLHPELCLVVVDYLQLMSGGGRQGGNREQEVSEYSRALKNLARESDVVVLALSQLNRAVETRDDKRPHLADLRESGAIEQDSDVVMFLYREDYYNPTATNLGETELIIRKQRNGPLGTIKLQFIPQYLRFDPVGV